MSRWEYREGRLRKAGQLPGPDGSGFDPAELFRLVRELKVCGVADPQAAQPALAAAAGRLGIGEADLFWAAVDAWERVETGPDNDLLSVAMKRAEDEPLPTDRRFDRTYQLVASLAYWLELFNAGRRPFFPFGDRRISAWLGVHRNTVGRVVAALEREGVIRVRRRADGSVYWDHKAGDCREVRYTGPRPEKESNS